MFTRIELPIELDLRNHQQITIGLDLDHLLSGLSFQLDGTTTHSALGDPVAEQLHENLRNAFRILNSGIIAHTQPEPQRAPIDLPAPIHSIPIWPSILMV